MVQALFFGLKAAVLAIVLEAVVRIGKRALKNNVMIGLAAAASSRSSFSRCRSRSSSWPPASSASWAGISGSRRFWPAARTARSAIARSPTPTARSARNCRRTRARRLGWSLKIAAIFLALWLVPVLALLLTLGPGNVFSQIAVFFSKMAVVTFGGAYAVLAYVAQEAVETYGWLRPGEMLDGLGMAETTPGPLIMVLQFVGFMGAFRDPGGLNPMIAGTLGGMLATWVTFTPCFLWIFLGAPYVEVLRTKRALSAALATITAASSGSSSTSRSGLRCMCCLPTFTNSVSWA